MLNKQKSLSLLFVMLFVFSFSFISSQESLGVFKQDSTVQLLQTCSICEYVTLDSIKLPDSTILIIDENMTKNGSTFLFEFNQTQLLGEYIYNTVYGNWTAPVSFEIESSNLILLLFLLGLASLFFIATLVVNEEFFVYISGVLFLISGLYIMMYGIDIINDDWSRAISFVTIGLGLLFTVGAYIFNSYENKEEEE
jgi:hypothetical protein